MITDFGELYTGIDVDSHVISVRRLLAIESPKYCPSVAWELASSKAVSGAMLMAEEHTEKTSESPPSKSSMVAKVGIEEEKGKPRAQVSHKISVDPIGNETSYIGHLLARFGIEASIPRLTTSPRGPRLLLSDY